MRCRFSLIFLDLAAFSAIEYANALDSFAFLGINLILAMDTFGQKILEILRWLVSFVFPRQRIEEPTLVPGHHDQFASAKGKTSLRGQVRDDAIEPREHDFKKLTAMRLLEESRKGMPLSKLPIETCLRNSRSHLSLLKEFRRPKILEEKLKSIEKYERHVDSRGYFRINYFHGEERINVAKRFIDEGFVSPCVKADEILGALYTIVELKRLLKERDIAVKSSQRKNSLLRALIKADPQWCESIRQGTQLVKCSEKSLAIIEELDLTIEKTKFACFRFLLDGKLEQADAAKYANSLTRGGSKFSLRDIAYHFELYTKEFLDACIRGDVNLNKHALNLSIDFKARCATQVRYTCKEIDPSYVRPNHEKLRALMCMVYMFPNEKAKTWLGYQKTPEVNKSKASKARVRTISGTKYFESRPGKSRFLLDGKLLNVEEYALQHFGTRGYSGFFSENVFWWRFVTLLYWDYIFSEAPKNENDRQPHLAAERPNALQDLPDLFWTDLFFKQRADIFETHTLRLESWFNDAPEKLSTYLYSNLEKSKFIRWFKGDMVSTDDFLKPIELFDFQQISLICERLLSDFSENRTGMPDLFLFRNGLPLFVEVKQVGEQISQKQIEWHNFLIDNANLAVEICRVESKS